MKLLDENKRLFGIVNPVDLVAIMLAIAAVVVLASVLFGRSPTSPVTAANDKTIEIVLEGTVIGDGDFNHEIGQDVSRSGGSGVMGTLESFDIEPSKREVYDAEGSALITDSLTIKTVVMVVRGKGSITDTGASIGAERIRQNQVFDAQLPYFQMSARVTSIKQVK
ncbi:MAG: DUF4330 domain-containing protein [Coriobacteriia bacterium]|nr:DUF4330 domain-containing protein [Coriobacteriia bacterium]